MDTRKPTHPGIVFYNDVVKPLGISDSEAAKRLGVTRSFMRWLIMGKKNLSPEMAIKFAIATNTSPESWYNMQTKIDLWHAKQKTYNVEECCLIPVQAP